MPTQQEIIDSVDTIVILMMENRSFDQMLGYLSAPPYGRRDIEGFVEGFEFYRCPFGGREFGLYEADGTEPVTSNDPAHTDPPHETSDIAAQINGGKMDGFVRNFPFFEEGLPPANPGNGQALAMGYFSAASVPTLHFLADQFTVCDQYFCSLPAGTQPNRLMALSGFTTTDVNQTSLPDQPVVYDWLTDREVRWRLYHEGLPFIALMPSWGVGRVLLDDHFRSFASFAHDWLTESPSDGPQVIFVEPHYTDDPISFGQPDDDHAPTPVAAGQAFLMRIYQTLISRPDKWDKTILIIVYDEHGGFFDHVPPPTVITSPPAGAAYSPFATVGVRVPALVVSPLVEPGSVCHDFFDHVSILKLLGLRFDPSGVYSPETHARPVSNLATVITRTTPRQDIPQIATPLGQATGPTVQGFQQAWDSARADYPAEIAEKHDALARQKRVEVP